MVVHTRTYTKLIFTAPHMVTGEGGYSLYSDDRDDCHNYFLGVVIGDLVFLGVVQERIIINYVA